MKELSNAIGHLIYLFYCYIIHLLMTAFGHSLLISFVSRQEKNLMEVSLVCSQTIMRWQPRNLLIRVGFLTVLLCWSYILTLQCQSKLFLNVALITGRELQD